MGKLGHYEPESDAVAAIAREKQIKAGSRAKRLKLINDLNPGCRDLYYDLV
jgi:putative endonuclease